ncbi:MAG TPA: NUDIX hydrolase [Mycobacteriales bacterium]|nr:NUDIX hydrolase [Mycobacteriales bacterium]
MVDDATAQMFAGLVDTVKRLAAGELVPATPRDAATVILLREHSAGPEVYLLRRKPTMAFAAGFFVFPGGSVDPRDESFADDAWVGPPPDQWASRLSCDEPVARSLVCAAVRETFEESGVLLAGRSAADVVEDTSGAEWEADRVALLDRSVSLAELLERRGLVLRADLLQAWSHWITPEVEPKRFDTRFFVAVMPAGQRTRDVGGEADRVVWVTAADALAANQRGELAMLPPTRAALDDLAAYPDVAAVMAGAADRAVEPVMPKLVLDENEQVRFLLPADPDYR